ncbi:MAG: AmmeMemoRadiSam system protein B [Bacteroidales bacterium]
MKKGFIIIFTFLTIISCKQHKNVTVMVRQMADTVGFANKAFKADSVIARIQRLQADSLNAKPLNESFRMAICPHDDYTYVGWQYPAVLRNIQAKTVIIFGVAHKAKKFNLENKLIFDGFDYWHGPYSNIKISDLRDKIIRLMPTGMAEVHDSMHIVEHSIESMLPILQHFNPDVEIVPIVVPYMSLARIDEISKELARAIDSVAKENKLTWGKDFALLITTDAVHYGDEDWGGKNYAPFGADPAGYQKAVAREHEIISSCLTGNLTPQRIQKFFAYTVNPNDYREYQWTWCGRYSVPMGLSAGNYLNNLRTGEPLIGGFIGYSTSIDHSPLPVDDIGMGRTAIANIHHWVGYASVGYR